ncbi:hypothetical protein [Streptomyces sp. H27-H5]|uniref:hypothetical protein n=1 Tax=Streptomyces sp. H27-H5 TaxID=2996460 RepID=UPI00226D902E|nr:hypothetical protein [Streptomyces sp. H27-H5]MCY0962081.1 hypothetical protein [Streptomyces sp. H27-H5]
MDFGRPTPVGGSHGDTPHRRSGGHLSRLLADQHRFGEVDGREVGERGNEYPDQLLGVAHHVEGAADLRGGRVEQRQPLGGPPVRRRQGRGPTHVTGYRHRYGVVRVGGAQAQQEPRRRALQQGDDVDVGLQQAAVRSQQAGPGAAPGTSYGSGDQAGPQAAILEEQFRARRLGAGRTDTLRYAQQRRRRTCARQDVAGGVEYQNSRGELRCCDAFTRAVVAHACLTPAGSRALLIQLDTSRAACARRWRTRRRIRHRRP